uniref:Uncharacterized protein n=1 Tax=viral metagenome TaxID=1070528 RepID=A0A6C0KUK4_9ZZZZ
MSTQIFKNHIPNDIFFQFLEKVCFKNINYYAFNPDSFKKGIYTEDIKKFLDFCRPYYHISKRNYIDRKLTYNSFTTIIRHICKFNDICFTSEIKYDKSDYSIFYYIYF